MKLYQPKFCAAPGPSGPERIIPGTVFCAPEILHEGIGVSPVNGGPGENELEPEGTCSRRRCESPPAILWFLSHRWERNSPRRAKPCETARRVVAPYGCHGPRERAGLGPAPTTSQTDRSRTGQWEGQAPPLRDGWGDIPRRRTSGRPHGAPPTAYPSGPPDNPRKHRKSPPA